MFKTSQFTGRFCIHCLFVWFDSFLTLQLPTYVSLKKAILSKFVFNYPVNRVCPVNLTSVNRIRIGNYSPANWSSTVLHLILMDKWAKFCFIYYCKLTPTMTFEHQLLREVFILWHAFSITFQIIITCKIQLMLTNFFSKRSGVDNYIWPIILSHHDGRCGFNFFCWIFLTRTNLRSLNLWLAVITT